MSSLELYRELYDYEKDSNRKLFAMLASVPSEQQADQRFQRAVNLAAHLASCREYWLTHLVGDGGELKEGLETDSSLETLEPRFAALEARWTDYLAVLSEAKLKSDFEFSEGGERFRLSSEVQILQLVLHALYHRGQIALLVDQLGGETLDTDYVDWVWQNRSSAGQA